MHAFYNEIDPRAAAWLRELINQNHIAPGIVDERSIEDINPDELSGYTQVHFFAGIGGWSRALRISGWPDNKPVWTGSCPCQPFSTAGKGEGFDDERHLWPAFHWLIAQCRPSVVFGEQVANGAAKQWLDLVQTDMEGIGFRFASAAFPACAVGAPHQRMRAYWLADTNSDKRSTGNTVRPICKEHDIEHGGGIDGLADTEGTEQQGIITEKGQPLRYNETVGMADSTSVGQCGGSTNGSGEQPVLPREGVKYILPREYSSATKGFWGGADWLGCRDGTYRPVEPGTFPLADGVSQRVVRVRGYGNSIVPQQAQAFITSYLLTYD